MACNYKRACGYLTVDGQDVGDVLIAESPAHPLSCAGSVHAPGGSRGVPLSVKETEGGGDAGSI
jgi:hypothetical protein